MRRSSMPNPVEGEVARAAGRDRTAAINREVVAAQADPGGFVGRGAEVARTEVDRVATVVEPGA